MKPGLTKFIVQNTGSRSHEFNIKGLYNFGRIAPKTTQTFGIDLSTGTWEVYSSIAVDESNEMVAPITISK
jgi:hypothetical protein